jgi:NodT family efflux transporter outer membrane factor (OMF) lipoprotein
MFGKSRGLGWLIGCCLALVVGLCGCMTPGPTYQPQHPDLPSAWSTADEQAFVVRTGEITRWWENFDDPMLTSLIEKALISNPGIQLAEARLREARAARRGVVSAEGPSVSAGGSYKKSHTPAGANSGWGSATADGYDTNQYQAGFDASWELDIFGGIRRAVEAADADVQTQVEAGRDVLVSVAAEVAASYIDLRTYQQRVLVAKSALETQKKTVKLTRKRYDAGLVTRLDLVNAEAQVATTESQIPTLEVGARQAMFALAILLGKAPADLDAELSTVSQIPAALGQVPVGVPSDLCRRRPDIRQAEAAIHAATARVGVATADLFPKFYLTGSAGYQNTSASSLVDWSSRFWSIGPSMSWPVFDSGKIRSNIAVREAQQEQAVLGYRQKVLGALQEVENALVAASQEAARQDALRKSVEANRKSLDLSLQLYSGGQTDFLSVLQAQRALYTAEDTLYQSFRTVSTQLVALYKALGGGWEAERL